MDPVRFYCSTAALSTAARPLGHSSHDLCPAHPAGRRRSLGRPARRRAGARPCGAGPRLEVWGVGGDRLRAAGMHMLVDTADVATMGFVETFGTLGRLIAAYRQLRRFMIEQRPALLVLIDYPEFNLLPRQARQGARHPGFLLTSAPQVWAWRRGRMRKIAQPRRPPRRRLPVRAAALQQRTASWRSSSAIRCSTWCMRRARAPRPWRATISIRARPLLALLPGSRKKEIRYLLPPGSPRRNALAAEGWQVVIALAHTLDARRPRRRARRAAAGCRSSRTTPTISSHAADAALVASGTATLETALLGRPMVIMYRVSPADLCAGAPLWCTSSPSACRTSSSAGACFPS